MPTITSNNIVERSWLSQPSGTPYRLPNMSLATAVDATTDHLHIGNEWVSHSGLNWYDNTARMHDPVLMRFTSPDPLWADYPSTSAWTHCTANPLNFIDRNGCEFSGDVALVDNYTRLLEDMRTAAKMSMDRMVSYEMTNFCNKQLAQLKILKKSNVVYELVRTPSEFGYLNVDNATGNVLVHLPENNDPRQILPMTGHELQHCYQFETGALSAVPQGVNQTPMLYDIYDEDEAYTVSNIVFSGIFYYTIPNVTNSVPYPDSSGAERTFPYRWTKDIIIEIGGGYEHLPKENLKLENSKDPKIQLLKERGEYYNTYRF